MKKLSRNIKRLFLEPRLELELFIRKYPKLFTDKFYLGALYRLRFGRRLNWSNPKSFNEKLSWLKIHDRNPLYTILADKYDVKRFVSELIGEEYIVPTLFVVNSIHDLDYDKLPQSFVIKATHDSSGAVIVKNKDLFSLESIRDKYNMLMKRNYFWHMREWPYKNIKPRIIVDQYLGESTNDSVTLPLRDYKFCCFNGEPQYMYITVKDINIFENFYDKDFHIIDINHGYKRHLPEFIKPKNYDKMWELAGVLAKASKAPFIRVDFFNINGKIFFGEYTFYDWGGLKPFTTFCQDIELGAYLDISKFN